MKKFISLILLLFIQINLFSKYIVFDKQDNKYRDYGSITNYCKALEEINREYIKQKKDYSNLIIVQSNWLKLYKEKADYMEKRYKPKWYEKLWDSAKFWVGLFTGLYILDKLK